MPTRLCRTDMLKPGQMRQFLVGDKKILLVRTQSGYHAVDELCSHEDYSLALGCIQGEMIKCSLHGSRFDLRTGEPMEEPACEPIAVYRLILDGDAILIDL